MGVIYNETLYPFTAMLAGSTLIGSLPPDHPTNANGTVQFTIDGIVEFMMGKLDYVNYDEASRVGQHIVGNDPDYPETYNANINNGNRYFGTIKVFPPLVEGDIRYIARLRD